MHAIEVKTQAFVFAAEEIAIVLAALDVAARSGEPHGGRASTLSADIRGACA